jgi:hypothetical protein
MKWTVWLGALAFVGALAHAEPAAAQAPGVCWKDS